MTKFIRFIGLIVIVALSFLIWMHVFRFLDVKLAHYEQNRSYESYKERSGLPTSADIGSVVALGLKFIDTDPRLAEQHFKTALGLSEFKSKSKQGIIRCYVGISRQKWIDPDYSSPICNLQEIFDACNKYKQSDPVISKNLSQFESKNSRKECDLRAN